jgi:hypothetical protein
MSQYNNDEYTHVCYYVLVYERKRKQTTEATLPGRAGGGTCLALSSSSPPRWVVAGSVRTETTHARRTTQTGKKDRQAGMSNKEGKKLAQHLLCAAFVWSPCVHDGGRRQEHPAWRRMRFCAALLAFFPFLPTKEAVDSILLFGERGGGTRLVSFSLLVPG